MIIGASATIGMVWLTIAQGITDISMVLLCTIPTASSTPRPAPMAKPTTVAESVTQP